MDKAQILSEIRRTAVANGGTPLGSQRFSVETGIERVEWQGKLWARWSDAVKEAGLTPNQMTEAYSTDHLLQTYADYTKELGRLPTANDLRLKDSAKDGSPTSKVYERLGTKSDLVRQLAEFCRPKVGYSIVVTFCESYLALRQAVPLKRPSTGDQSAGYVYLYQHGSRQEYKIGKTFNTLRREGELRVELPEKIEPIHFIKTDDPSGVEAYWHGRFSEKRKNGEWFVLSADDVRAFKRWKRIF